MITLSRDVAGACLTPRGSVVAVGAFDGLHRGHQALLAQVRERARALDVEPVVVSFEPLPRAYFSREPLPRLSSVREKLRGFDAAGMTQALLLRFNAALAAMTAEDFVRRVLVERLAAREVWVGGEFRFGHRRAGDVALLENLGETLGFVTRTMAPVTLHDERVSATRVRELLAAGDFTAAAALLGRPFVMEGKVEHGNQLGRALGYPTANIHLRERVSPIHGIFAVRVGLGACRALVVEAANPAVRGRIFAASPAHGGSMGQEAAEIGAAQTDSQPGRPKSDRLLGNGECVWPGVASLGVRPTVNEVAEPLLEVHLFDFEGDLYGQRMAVEFVGKLRDEQKFDDLDALTAQMDRDAAAARAMLGMNPVLAGA